MRGAVEGNVIHQWQEICCRLAGAGLSAGNQIVPVKDDGNRLLLYGCGFPEAHIFDCIENIGVQVKLVESHKCLSNDVNYEGQQN